MGLRALRRGGLRAPPAGALATPEAPPFERRAGRCDALQVQLAVARTCLDERVAVADLLELTRISRAVPRESVDRTFVDRLALLRGKLERNQDVLLVHLNAAQEISRVLTVALGEAESDGTYSRQAAQTGVGAPS